MPPENPLDEFRKIWEKLKSLPLREPAAMTLSTVGADGQPRARTVLLKSFDDRGFVFYTNLESRKGNDIAANPRACLLFYRDDLALQVNIEGSVERVSDDEADTYWNSRPRSSQLGGWASDQSRPLSSRFALLRRVAKFGIKFAGKNVPRPPHWTGLRVVPQRIEFWHGKTSRLHERYAYTKTANGWIKTLLNP